MATTEAALQANEATELAFSLVVDGYNLVFTTTSDTSGIATAYSSTDWTTVKGGLEIVGSTTQEIDPFQPRIKADGLSFRILDTDGTIRQLLFGNPSTTVATRLAQTLEANATTAYVRDVASFGASGTFYIGHEAIAYTGKTNGNDLGGQDAWDRFTGLTRGKWSLFGVDGGTRIGRRHQIQTDTSIKYDDASPEVRSTPRAFYNRMVGLVLHHKEYSGAGVGSWSTATLPFADANAQMLWAGRIKAWADDGTGWVTIQCVSVKELLESSIWLDQYRAVVHEGLVINDAESTFQISQTGSANFVSSSSTLSGSSPFVSAIYRYDEIVSMIQSRLTSLQPDGALYTAHGAQKWCIELRQTDSGPRVVVEVEPGVALATGCQLWLKLHPKVGDMLGLAGADTVKAGFVGVQFAGIYEIPVVDPTTRTLFRLVAPKPPQIYMNTAGLRGSGTTSDAFVSIHGKGTWANQPTVPEGAESGAEGFVSVGGRILAVTQGEQTINGTIAGVFSVLYSLDQATADSSVGSVGKGFSIDNVAPPVEVFQVWNERGKAGELLLKLILSTGASGYNSATYDVYSAGFGLGIPYGLLDVQSFLELDADYELYLDKSEPFGKLLEECLQTFNRHLIFEDGKLRLTPPGFDAPVADDIITLDETTKADPMERTGISYAVDGIINRVHLEYTTLETLLHRDFQDTRLETARNSASITVADLTSESDFGHRRTLEIKARGILDPDGAVEYVIKPALAYFSRPFGVIVRSINAQMFHLVPGDIVQLTDNSVTDPTTGSRGVSGLACWVRRVVKNWQACRGEVELVFLPEHPASRYAKWSPSALVDSTYNTGDYDAGYDSVAYKLKLVAKTFGRSADSNDIAYFTAGDVIQAVERSPVDPTNPDISYGTIQSINTGTNEITLTGALSGDAWDITNEYIIEARPYTNQTTTQRAFANIGDTTDWLIGGSAQPKNWAGAYKGITADSTAIDYSTEYIRPSTQDDEDEEPWSSRKGYDLIKSLNNLLAYKTRNVLVNEAATYATRTTVGTDYGLVWGPVWVPLYGGSRKGSARRQILGKARIYNSDVLGTTTVKLVSSASLVRGSTDSSLIYDVATSSQTATTSSTSATWVDLAAFSPVACVLDGQLGTWLTVELKTSNALYTAGFVGLAVVEAAL